MPRLPRKSWKEAVQALRLAGFAVFDQEGIHVYLHLRIGDPVTHRVTVPVHARAF
jgi:predicted RNA binding protein YcfA (HicA-like mRNA interferase family)